MKSQHTVVPVSCTLHLGLPHWNFTKISVNKNRSL